MADLRGDVPAPCSAAWDAMAPHGRHRVCARCDTVVHDLAALTIDEVEALVGRDPAPCVRARIDARGAVRLAPGPGGGARRLLLAVGASAGLLATAPAMAAGPRTGTLLGKVATFDPATRIVATAADGTEYRGRVKANGRYRIAHLPPGRYRLTFVPGCGDRWTADAVVVADTPSVLDTVDRNGCIVVGALRMRGGAG